MDFVSHILIGRTLATSQKNSKRDISLITFFSFLPDLPVIFVYLYLGFIKARPFLIPLNTDWDGFRTFHPAWSALWEVPHSYFFALLIILPFILFFKLPKMAFVAYLSHIFVDLFTHAGEWATKPFYPIPYQVHGLTNAWAWSLSSMVASWIVLLALIILLNFILRKNKKYSLQN